MHFFCLLSVHWFLHQDEGWSISRRFLVDIPKLLLCCAPIVIKYSDNLYSRFFQTFMQAYCIDKYQSFCCYVLYSDRTIVSSLNKTHVSHMCPKITDETHCDALCVKTSTKKKRKGVYNNEHWTVLFILIWHYKLRVKSPKNFILWEKMWKVSSRTGKWKIQRKTFPPPATSLQSKAEKCELKVFRKCCSRHGTREGLHIIMEEESRKIIKE